MRRMKVISIVNTEYHYKESDRIIYVVQPLSGARLTNIDSDRIDGIEWRWITYDYSKPTRDIKPDIDQIILEKPDILFFCNENKFWYSYLFSRLHRCGSTIAFLPDGMSAYVEWSVPFRKWLKAFIEHFVDNARVGTYFPVSIPRRFYASNRYIDEVWVEYPSSFVNRAKKRIVQFSLPNDNPIFLDQLSRVFSLSDNSFSIDQNSVFFIDSAFENKAYFEFVVKLLSYLKRKRHYSKVFIKMHPHSSKVAEQYYSGIEDCVIIRSTYPAELYIANLHNCLIVSVFSTAMLYYNRECEYVWVYELCKNFLPKQVIHNPTEFIKVVNSVEEI